MHREVPMQNGRVLARVLAEDLRDVRGGTDRQAPTTTVTSPDDNPNGRPDITNTLGGDGD